MSTSSFSTKPLFSNTEEEPVLSKPLSKLALASMVLGVIGLLAPITGTLMFLPILAAVIGLVASVWLSSQNSSHSGAWMANVGLFLGLFCSTWSIIATKASRESLAKNSSEFAIFFLEALADGKVYVAAELQQPFLSRQLAGLDLQAYYESYKGDPNDRQANIFGDDEPDLKMEAKQRINDLKAHAVTKYVQKYPKAEWLFEGIDHIRSTRNSVQTVVVVLVNSEDRNGRISIALERQKSERNNAVIAEWHVQDMKLL